MRTTYEEEDISPEEAGMRKFENGITFVESLVSLTHGERRMTPSNMMVCLMDDRNLRNFAIDVTGTRNFVGLVRKCISHYGLKNGSWAEHIRKLKHRSRYVSHANAELEDDVRGT